MQKLMAFKPVYRSLSLVAIPVVGAFGSMEKFMNWYQMFIWAALETV